MAAKVDYVRKKYAPMLDKNLENAVAHRIREDFPRIGGPIITRTCAQIILKVVEGHLRPREHLRHGQILWMGFSVDDPPRRGKRTRDAQMAPLVLDLSLPEDIQGKLAREDRRKCMERKLVRLCKQAYEQKALLSGVDLAEILNVSHSYISKVVVAYEKRTGELLPRRATLHDVGTGLTHKAIICRQHFQQGKSPDEVARSTYHSQEAVDRYLGQYDRVRHCRGQGMNARETAHILSCSVRLVEEYLAIQRELEGDHA